MEKFYFYFKKIINNNKFQKMDKDYYDILSLKKNATD